MSYGDDVTDGETVQDDLLAAPERAGILERGGAFEDTRGRVRSPRQCGATAGGIGGLLARSDKMLFMPIVLSSSNPDPQYVNTTYYHSDAGGNVTALIQPSGFPVAGYEYDAFGNIISISGMLAGLNKYRFSSKAWDDNSGLYYYGYRFYDPNLQRWVNRDPIGEYGGGNLYDFVFNDPTSWVDLFGECPAAAFAGKYPGLGTGEALGKGLGRAIAGASEIAGEGVAGALTYGAMVFGPIIGGVGNWYETNPNGVNAPPLSVDSPYTFDRSTLPIKNGPPNGSLAEDKGNGKGTIREYGPDGRAKTDYDFGHDHGHGDPHAHDWDWTNPNNPARPGRPLCPGE